jgi:ATP-binding protein involved in chromosome partitioning
MGEPTEQAVREALSRVRDPATDRDIVSSRQLVAIAVEPGRVRVRIDLISPGYPHVAQLDDAVRAALAPLGLAVDIEHGLSVPRKPPRPDLDRLPTIKNTVAVTAGKGGVGKSTVAVNLAVALQGLGARAGILDADIYGPSVPHMMGPPERHADKATDRDKIVPAIHRGIPVMSVDFFVRTGQAVIWRGPMIHKLLQQFLEDVEWGQIDYLVIDLPPGTGDAQLSLGQLIPITGAVVVTTPQDVALLDVRKAVDMFRKLEIPLLGVIENMSTYVCPACGFVDHVFAAGGGSRLARELSTELLAELPLDAKVAIAGERGIPIVLGEPGGEHAAAFTRAAAAAALAASKLSATGPIRSSRLRTV